MADNVAYGNGINGMVVHYTDRAALMNNTIANNGTVPLDAHRQRNSGLAINHSQDLEIVNNRVQVNVAGDAAIKVFGPTSGIRATGNQYAGGSSDLKMGFARYSPFGTGRRGVSIESACLTLDGRSEERRMGDARKGVALVLSALVWITTTNPRGHAQSASVPAMAIPKTWDNQAIATLEVPVADPIGSPKHVSADYYYAIPVALYKSYSVYAPGHEPPGYMDWLERQDPQIIWDDAGHAPALRTAADWLKAGEVVFDAPVTFVRRGDAQAAWVTDRAWLEQTATPVAGDGTLPFARYVIRRKGEVELGDFSCSTCHTRVLPDGSVLKGAQGNLPFNQRSALRMRAEDARTRDSTLFLRARQLRDEAMRAAPWLTPDPQARLGQMSIGELATELESMPPGVISRQRASLFYPVQVPDLVGVQDRHYLDRKGLVLQRSIGDIMRYAAMNRGAFDGGDNLANHNGFIPADPPSFRTLPTPATQGRYSDEQLYALALYLSSLRRPPNPNSFDAVAARGEKVFGREGCATCHTTPLYSNNKLTPAV